MKDRAKWDVIEEGGPDEETLCVTDACRSVACQSVACQTKVLYRII